MDSAATTIQEPSTCERRLVVERVRRFGGLATDAVLDPSTQIFTTPSIDGLIGYRKVDHCVTIFGDPICKSSDVPALTGAFHLFLEKQNLKKHIYVTTSEQFSKWSLGKYNEALVEFGEELILDPTTEDPRVRHGTHASLVRRKVRHAQHEGTNVYELTTHDPLLEQALEQVAQTWLKGRRGPQIHISPVRLFADREGKRWFYAKSNERIVGLIVLNQLQSKQGWLFNHLMITPEAPHGTPELLVISAIEKVSMEGCRFITFGNVIQEHLGEIVGFSKFSTFLLNLAFNSAKFIFHLTGSRTFWEKFHPRSERSYLLFKTPEIGISEIKSIMKALNVRF